MDSIMELGLTLLSYDPNFADDSMDSDGDNDENDDSDAELEDCDYSDEDDMSWKVRRAAAHLLASVFTSYPDKISNLYELCSPRLVARFREREENIKLDVFSTFSVLLNQVAVAGAASGDGAHLALFARDEAALLQNLSRQLNTKSLKVKCGIFDVLKVFVQANPSCMQVCNSDLVFKVKSSVVGIL